MNNIIKNRVSVVAVHTHTHTHTDTLLVKMKRGELK